MPGLLQSLFPCFGGEGDEQQRQPVHHEQLTPPPKLKPGSPRTSSNAPSYTAPVPVSEPPGSHISPIYRPDTDKKLPPKPTTDHNAVELPASSPDLYEVPATYIPGSHPLARPSSHATSSDLPRPSQQSEQIPHSPFSTHTTLAPGSPAGSNYQPSGSVRAPSERGDPDEISPAPSNSQDHPRGGKPNMYSNVADALTDRKRMFERLRQTNGVEGQQSGESAGNALQSAAVPQASGPPTQAMGSVAPVEMWAPMHQPAAAPSELAAREHVRNPSEPKELE